MVNVCYAFRSSLSREISMQPRKICQYQFVSEDGVEPLLCLLHRFVVFLHGKEGKRRKNYGKHLGQCCSVVLLDFCIISRMSRCAGSSSGVLEMRSLRFLGLEIATVTLL
jgi:hypothetical protein